MINSIDNIIIGFGATGMSVAQFLTTQNQKFMVVDNNIKDTSKVPSDIILMNDKINNEKLFMSAKRLIVSPGVPIANKAIQTAKQSGVEVLGDIELFAKEMPKYNAKVVAITGSNGKSTCVSLLYEMAKLSKLNVKLGGNIGTPALDLLNDYSTELFILELSSFQLETTKSLDCEVSAILNISKDHLDRYDTYSAYIDAKKHLLKQSQQVVIFKDDAEIIKWKNIDKIISFTLSPPKPNEYGIVDGWLKHGDDYLIKTTEIKLKGKHNFANALACLAIGDVLGLPQKAMFNALRTFKGLPHRSELVATINGVDWINDSKATNVGATVAAISGLYEGSKNIILLIGGQSKGADMNDLSPWIKKAVKMTIIFGEDALSIKNSISDDSEHQLVKNLEEACFVANDIAIKGDLVLLSPACASFDLFANFIARGEAFIKIVASIK